MTFFILFIILSLNFAFLPDCNANKPPISVKTNDISCFNKSDGSIDITLTEMISESFSIEVRSKSAGTIATFNESSKEPLSVKNLNAGDYTIWYSNYKDKENLTVTIESPALLKANVISIVSFSGENESFKASIRANPIGGTEPYTISWSENAGSQSGAEIHGLPMGVYKCTIIDANQCGEVTATIFLYDYEIEKFKNETSK